MFRTTTMMTATAAALLAAPAFAESHGDGSSEMSGDMASPAAMATLMDQSGTEVGQVDIYETVEGLLFHVEATGMPEGAHGFHVHQTGECSDDFTSAGDHYQPGGNGHGLMSEEGAHAGDLPNVFADDSGNVRADLTSARLSMEDGDAPIMDDDGSAIIVHENGDTYSSDAGAGGRIACGVIEAAS
ncbi:copper/Zinc superoxide dismutase [Roseivivax marinus]|jgi:Cu-Zn family superoxide dismutase|uniref:Copper/Zinc superoxide dismutase n=1 Tax=Roseivivax marinus TaxID=1379903 RepID=W4HJ58_9RHOB|nr:superoxide dismutase family protein [Roseivivax marinus]ETW12438.1 copper/Zinc superoxide dismutase [Roseivivax marinus]